MNKLINIVSILLTLLTFSIESHSQESVNSSGKDISGNGGTVSYSIGQVAFITNSGINGSVAQGVQQVYEIFVLTGLDDKKGININCKAYPNPTTQFLFLKIESLHIENMSFQLFDMNGRLLLNRDIEDFETTIPMSEYVPATYFLHVFENKLNVKTFKIIKH
ncbi:MAG TPA: T9SS type A sorting domain-containing protein [Draconibacterium sp.]|nr:T9SS type A sorting domain-containing protein [Draconibacterium sp.]